MTPHNQKGVSLIITLFIMMIILSVVLSISAILYSQIKVVRNISNSMVGFYAADSGIEKVLYYDKQVVPNGAKRGLCSIFSSCTSSGGGYDGSVYCGSYTTTDCPSSLAPAGTHCTSSDCTNCNICFSTVFNGRTYYTTAKISPDGTDPTSSSDLNIKSQGVFAGAQRQIETFMVTKNNQ